MRRFYLGLEGGPFAGAGRSPIPLLGFARRVAYLWRSYLAARYLQARRRFVIFVRYPYEALKIPPRFRGHIELVRDPSTGRALCFACKLCERACPSDCIAVEGVKLEGAKKRSVSAYKLDFTKCSLCGSCVEACRDGAPTPLQAMFADPQPTVVSQATPGEGEKIVVGPIDVELVRRERSTRLAHQMMAHLRTEAHPVYRCPGYPAASFGSRTEFTYKDNEETIEQAKKQRGYK